MQTGTPRPLTRYGDPVLHEPCAEVTEFSPELGSLIDDMFASMYKADGVGLAANQVGVGLRVFVYDCEVGGTRHIGHVVNPVFSVPKGRRHLDVDTEGCLSVPGPYATLARADEATVIGQDRTGQAIKVTGTGLLARCLQHEVDHLEGIVYVDRLTPRKRRAILADAGLAS
jgi:peptide deformylase